MELQIQDLVSSIKKEGIEAARAEAESILAKAREEAASIVAKAREEAAKITARSADEIETLRQSARVSSQQALRDATLSFKGEVQKEFEKILAADVQKTMQGETLGTLIAAALAQEDPSRYVAEVAEVTESVKGKLAQQVRDGLELRVSKAVRSGFRLCEKDGSGYFDCTDEEITQMLLPFFSDLSI